jgi:glycosyltransferase involved in cell wall biosynthesis
VRVIIYESSSFGGCYDYSIYLANAYKENSLVTNISLVLPFRSGYRKSFVSQILFNDALKISNKKLSALYFLLRNFLNPFIFFFYLLFRKKSLVIFNDFEQISAPFWVPFYKIFLRRHTFSVILHDPDRDAYPPSPRTSAYCMSRMMSLMSFGFYHDFLPGKNYYSANSLTRYYSVPHGLYVLPDYDKEFFLDLRSMLSGFKVISITGNIRAEKNYEHAVRALKNFPDVKLLIAGKAANSTVNPESLKALARSEGVSDRVVIIEKFLTEAELASVIKITDVVLLYYSRSFKSQSGIINIIAPYAKKTIIADTESGLASLARKFKLGTLAIPDNPDHLVKALNLSLNTSNDESEWDEYMNYASWANHVNLVLGLYSDSGK